MFESSSVYMGTTIHAQPVNRELGVDHSTVIFVTRLLIALLYYVLLLVYFFWYVIACLFLLVRPILGQMLPKFTHNLAWFFSTPLVKSIILKLFFFVSLFYFYLIFDVTPEFPLLPCDFGSVQRVKNAGMLQFFLNLFLNKKLSNEPKKQLNWHKKRYHP